MIKIRISTILIASFLSLFVLAQVGAGDAKLSDQDKKFMEKAAMGSMMEVRLGELAKEKAESEDVKEFGQRMVQDHSKANEKLKEIAQENNFSLPEKLDEKHQKTVDKLSGLSGKEFDRRYMSEMVKDHDKDLELFRKEAQQGQNPELKEFASNTVDKLEKHHQLAMNIHQQVSGQAEKKMGSQTQVSGLDAGKAKDWIGWRVTGKDGEELGKVKNIYLSQDESKVLYVNVKGESDKMHPVPADLLRPDKEKKELIAQIDKKMFDKSPSFDEKDRPELGNESWSQEIRAYYEREGQEKVQPKE